jgi:hypothetical protein
MLLRRTRRVAVIVFLSSLGFAQGPVRDQPVAMPQSIGIGRDNLFRAISGPGQSTTHDPDLRATKPEFLKYSTDFAWAQSPSSDLSRPGAKTVSLPACPTGVKGTDLQYTGSPSTNPFYYVYIAGTGTPEAVLVTGGTCAGNGVAGTLTFTTVNAHAAGYTISSATAGIQEASIAAKLDIVSGTGAHYYQDGYVRVPPGIHDLRAPLTFVANHQTIDFSGAVVRCNFDTVYCIGVGRSDNYVATSNVTLIKPRAIPTVTGSTESMIAVFGQKTRIFNAMPMIGPPNNGGFGTFGHIVTVVGDQAFLLDGLDTTADTNAFGGCTASWCPSAVYAPGPFTGPGTWGTGKGNANAAVGWLKHLQIAPMCAGNGVDWQSGNVLHIEDSVIQGYAQFGIRWSMPGGGYGSALLDNLYEEGGCNSNPLGNVGYAGLIVEGGRVSIHGGEMPYGVYPTFANTGNTNYYYYIVATDGVNGPSNLLYAGRAQTNGTGNVTIRIPDIPSATSFDVLKSSVMYQAPYGTGNWAVATGVKRTSACAKGVCTFTDTQVTPASYNVLATPPKFFPRLDYWPGPLVLGPYAAGNSAAANSSLSLDFNDLNSVAIWQTNTFGSGGDSVDSTRCILMPGSPLWQACTGQDQDLASTMLHTKTNQDGGLAKFQNLKGRVNFASSGSGPSHFITLVDSNISKTMGAAGNRPQNDANDTFIGYDAGSGTAASIGLSFGAPVTISNYIGNVGDGTNWKERLWSGGKAFSVNVSAPVFNAKTGFQIGGSYGTKGQCLKSNGAGSVWGVCGSGTAASLASAKGSSVLPTKAIPPGACSNTVTAAATGATTSSVVHWSLGADPSGVPGYAGSTSGAVLQVYVFTTANAVNIRVCNNTSLLITPGQMSINWDLNP